MLKQVLFIQGAGGGAYREDAALADSLRHELGADYEVIFPEMPNEENPTYDEWKLYIKKKLDEMQNPVALVGHSIGSSMLLKGLGEIKVNASVAGVFLLSAPFWGGDGWHYDGYKTLEMPEDLADKLPQNMPITLYHCQDDEVVPYEHMALYKKLLPSAAGHTVGTGGHQFNGDLGKVAQDIKKRTA